MTPYAVITTTLASKEDAKALARGLLNEKLAACVQMMPIHSHYIYENEVRDEAEILMIIKTKAVLFHDIAAHLKAHHPYSVPQIIMTHIDAGSEDYLAWIAHNTR